MSSDNELRPTVSPDDEGAASLEPFEDLKRRVEITRDARFQANLRLERRQKSSYFLTSVLSLFVIVLSLIPNIYSLNQASAQTLLALTIVNSVFIIITTFLEASGNFIHKGEQLHRSARKIAAVFNRLMLLDEAERCEKEKIRNLQIEYQDSLDDCPFNHDNIDYDKVKATKPSLFKGRIYGGFGRSFFPFFRLFAYKFHEYSWTFPHAVVFLVTISVLYWMLVLDGFGVATLVTSP